MKRRGEQEIAEEILRGDVGDRGAKPLGIGVPVAAIKGSRAGGLRNGRVKRAGPQGEISEGFAGEMIPLFLHRRGRRRRLRSILRRHKERPSQRDSNDSKADLFIFSKV